MMNPSTDIIISCHITREFPNEPELEGCINSLVQHTSNYRIILVDDHSDEQGQVFISNIARHFRDCILIRTHFQHWFTRAFNLGLRMARTPYVVTLNSDTIPRAGWLEELYGVKEAATVQLGKRVGLVGSILSGEEPRRWAESVDLDYVTGHAWLLSMEALYEISAARGTPGIYLDETKAGTIHINSDVMACWEMNKLNWATIKSFKSHVDHYGGRSWGMQIGRISGLTLESVSYHYDGR